MTALHNWSDSDIAILEGVYTLQCKARMNAIYYEHRLVQLKRQWLWTEIAIALVACASGVGALLANRSWGSGIWQSFALLTAAIAIIRPNYAPLKQIESCIRQQQSYHAI